MIETIVSTLVGRVEADTIQQLATARPDNLGAYETVLQGLEFHKRSGVMEANAEKAFGLFEKAIEIDPNYARAHAWRACSLANLSDWRGNIMDALPECLSSEAVDAFNKLQIPTRNSLFYLAGTHGKIGDIDKASQVLKEAIAMSSLSVEEFVKTQKYRDPDKKENLLNSLTAIAA